MTSSADHEAAAILIAFCVSRTAGESGPSGDVNEDEDPPGASGGSGTAATNEVVRFGRFVLLVILMGMSLREPLVKHTKLKKSDVVETESLLNGRYTVTVASLKCIARTLYETLQAPGAKKSLVRFFDPKVVDHEIISRGIATWQEASKSTLVFREGAPERSCFPFIPQQIFMDF